MNHSFDIEHAKKYGVFGAVLIHNFMFWIAHNKANGKHFYDGRTWTYNSVAAFAKLFPYLSEPQIRRTLDSLEAQGVLITGNYNERAADRTKWYAFSDEWIRLFRQTHLLNSANGAAGGGKSLTKADGKRQKVNQIPPDGGRASRLAPDWTLPKTWGDWALANCPGWTAEHVRLVAEKFRDHWISQPKSKGVKLDWEATWRNWCRNEPAPKKEGAGAAGPWFSTESGILAKGAELGLEARPGELPRDFKARIDAEIERRSRPAPDVPPDPPGPTRLAQPFTPLPEDGGGGEDRAPRTGPPLPLKDLLKQMQQKPNPQKPPEPQEPPQ